MIDFGSFSRATFRLLLDSINHRRFNRFYIISDDQFGRQVCTPWRKSIFVGAFKKS